MKITGVIRSVKVASASGSVTLQMRNGDTMEIDLLPEAVADAGSVFVLGAEVTLEYDVEPEWRWVPALPHIEE